MCLQDGGAQTSVCTPTGVIDTGRHAAVPVAGEEEGLGVVIGEVKVESPVAGGWGFEARGYNEIPPGLFLSLY